MLVYDEKYIKAKVKKCNGVIKTNLLHNEILKENVHYTCIACITIDSVMKMEKKELFYLEESKFIQKDANAEFRK